jgi:hypothetical protein
VIKWLWTANGSVFILALLILMIGLITLADTDPAEQFQTDGGFNLVIGDDSSSSADKSESPLVAMARKYSVRFNPPKPPVVKKPPKKKPPKPHVVKKPPKKEPPKPPVVKKPPKKVIPAPNFTLDATLLIGEHDGLAWIKPPKATQPNLYSIGKKIDQYEIVKIEHGLIELIREETSFTLKVPEPKKVASPTVKPKPVEKSTDRRSRKRLKRTPRTKK